MNPKYALLALIITFFWGVNFVALREVAVSLPPFLAIFIRFLITSILLFPFAFKVKRKQLLPLFALSFVMSVLYFTALFRGMSGVPAGEGCIVMQLEVPIAALLSAWILREKVSIRLWSAILIAIAGVTITVGMPQRIGDLTAIGFLLIAAFLWGVNSMQMKCLSEMNPLALNAWICLMSLPFLYLGVLFSEPNWIHIVIHSPKSMWCGMAYMVFISTMFCYSTWFWLLRKYPVSKLSPFCLFSPVSALIMSHFISGENLALHTLVGTGILLAGLALIVIKKDAASNTSKINRNCPGDSA